MTIETKKTARRARNTKFFAFVAFVAVLIAMFFGTKIVSGEEATADSGKFDPAAFASDNWDSEILPAILGNATDLVPLAAAIATDPAAAATTYGVVEGSSAPVYTASFTGIAGAAEGGIMPVTVDGLPAGVTVRVQVGPAINGMAIRDASGLVHFPQFTNQIDYQDAGTALNDVVKATVLDGIDTAALAGKSVTITGSFQLINPASFLVTPVEFTVS